MQPIRWRWDVDDCIKAGTGCCKWSDFVTPILVAIYDCHIGVVAIHVTNKYFDLKPTVARLGDEFGLDAHEYKTSDSVWMVLSPRETLTEPISEELSYWTLVPATAGTSLWTDDYANLLATLKRF